MNYVENVIINKPAGVNDGYDGGLHVLRDTTSLSGGTRGNVNTGIMGNTIAGKNVTAFEWAMIGKLDNYADAGENVGFYGQGNKFSTGPTWGACFEVCDTTTIVGAAVGTEVDCWVTGDDNGLRIGMDIVVGDSKLFRGMGASAKSIATTGLRIAASGGSTYAKWRNGILLHDFLDVGIHLNSSAARAIELKGTYIVGIDLSQATTQSGIRLAEGQRITFEATDTVSMSWSNGMINFKNGNAIILQISTTNGDIYKRGVKII